MIWAIIIILIVGIDQITKQIVASRVPYGEIYPVIDKFFYITYHENKGAAWGIMQNGRLFFIIVTLLVSSVMIYAISKSKNKVLKLSLTVILGGALGNFIDRVVKGGVGDFLDFYIFSYHFPTFNAADTFIVLGTILLAVFMLFIYKEPAKASNKAADGTEAAGGINIGKSTESAEDNAEAVDNTEAAGDEVNNENNNAKE